MSPCVVVLTALIGSLYTCINVCCRSANCTPRIRRTLLNASPRTPTPFKDAMADKKNKISEMVSLFMSVYVGVNDCLNILWNHQNSWGLISVDSVGTLCQGIHILSEFLNNTASSIICTGHYIRLCPGKHASWKSTKICNPLFVIDSCCTCMWQGMEVACLNTWVFSVFSGFLQHQWPPCAENCQWVILIWISIVMKINEFSFKEC